MIKKLIKLITRMILEEVTDYLIEKIDIEAYVVYWNDGSNEIKDIIYTIEKKSHDQ